VRAEALGLDDERRVADAPVVRSQADEEDAASPIPDRHRDAMGVVTPVRPVELDRVVDLGPRIGVVDSRGTRA
jgi:hypothetical protein